MNLCSWLFDYEGYILLYLRVKNTFVFLGRVHTASVSGIDKDGQNVTVEWFEYGETKGKEVTKSCNLRLNDF